jgi:glycosyltransferase involved in cell wall biosynthesis
VPYLLEAWRRLAWKDAELWIAGQNKLSAELRTKYGVLSRVRFLGHVSNPVQVFQNADAFVFPSLAEGSALVTYEALACGLPVLTTPNAGSIVRDGVEGFIVPIRDVDALANRLEQLRTDERLRKEMSKAARVRAEAYTWDRYGDTLVEAITKLVRMPPSTHPQNNVVEP